MENLSYIARDLLVRDPESGRVHLLGGRHRATGRLVFPAPDSEDYEVVPLGDRGHLWSFTIQRFRPKSPPYTGPEEFTPYAVGCVELPGQLIVETRITGIPFDQLRIGMSMQVTSEVFTDATGAQFLTYSFTSAEEV